MIVAIHPIMDGMDYISTSRVLSLLVGLFWAAYLDLKSRRVPNAFWITWASPAIFLWTLELLILETPWYIFATAAGVVAYASMSVLGTPSFQDIMKKSYVDIVVTIWYIFALFGILVGLYHHGNVNFLDLVNGNADEMSSIWWSTILAAIPILIFDLAWRLRLIHGGADAKALMWVAILIPSWNVVNVVYPENMDNAIIVLPPSISLLIWGGFIFLLLPFVMVIKNLATHGMGPLRLIWHAERMPLSEVKQKHVWLLSEMMAMPSGDYGVHHRTRAPRRTPTSEELDAQIEALKEANIEMVWVTRKYPLLVFLIPALLPWYLLGGPMAWFMPLIGL